MHYQVLLESLSKTDSYHDINYHIFLISISDFMI